MLASASSGCKPKGVSEVERVGTGAEFHSQSDLAPESDFGKKAVLLLAGASYPVSVALSRTDGQFSVRLVSNGEDLEEEDYRSEPEAFELTEADEERYAPPLPLLRFPMRVGDTWTWNGTMTSGGIGREASAMVHSTTDRLFVSELPHDTIKVAVDILLDANPGRPPLKRQLAFWFEPGHGMIKRAFGSASVRQPADH
jgi:hypothetical protein